MTPLPAFDRWPPYAALFVLRNLGPYARSFWLLTLASVLATGMGYGQVIVLSDVLSNIAARSVDDILGRSLPLYLLLVAGTQALDALTRRFSEALPSLVGGWFSQRALCSLFAVDHRQMATLSRERIGSLLSTWRTHVENFLALWFWNTARRLTEIVFVFVTLWQQDPRIFAAGLLGVCLFLGLSLPLSARMAPLAREQTEATVASQALEQDLLLQIPMLQRLSVFGFVADAVHRRFLQRVATMRRVRAFHAHRWLLQLGVFYALYALSLFTALVQIKNGVLAVGFVVTLRYAFDRLLMTLIFVVEQYVDCLQQRADASLLRDELGPLKRTTSTTSTTAPAPARAWQVLELQDARIRFRPRGLNDDIVISVPQLTLKRGDRVGILGPSGSGKTTILLQLLGLLPAGQALRVDGVVAQGPSGVRTSYINSTDPLLKLSLRDNILLGRSVSDERLRQVLDGVGASEWIGDLERQVGDEGTHLSAGQEQRVRLARGLVDDTVDLYLLDEPFSGLDEGTRDRVIDFLDTFLAKKTVVLVTHHSQELRWVQAVHVLEQGTLQERRSLDGDQAQK